MDIIEAKKLVINAGLRLVSSGLIARTWGNVSCRISENSFVITPSGRDYHSLTTDQIVEVKIGDCSYDGPIKPSSEKGVHAEVYKLHPHIGFVIHTHQENASIISAAGLDSIQLPGFEDKVICAAYALSGTKKLQKNVAKAMTESTVHAVIMKHHGALCFGKNLEDAFKTALQLESACEAFIEAEYLRKSGRTSFDALEMAQFALAQVRHKTIDLRAAASLHNSLRTKTGFSVFDDMGNNIRNVTHKENMLFKAIYDGSADINHILYKCTPEIAAVANSGMALRPLLDDFAQLVGVSTKNVELHPQRIADALRKVPVVLVPGYGALCCGKTKDDAVAAQLLVQKACRTLIGASILGTAHPLSIWKCLLMRYGYLFKYSRQIDKK